VWLSNSAIKHHAEGDSKKGSTEFRKHFIFAVYAGENVITDIDVGKTVTIYAQAKICIKNFISYFKFLKFA
jgi:hypothetical protein